MMASLRACRYPFCLQTTFILLLTMFTTTSLWAQPEVKKGVVRYSVSHPKIIDVDLRDLPVRAQWKPGDPIVEVPLRGSANDNHIPEDNPFTVDPLISFQEAVRGAGMDQAFANPIVNFDAQGPLGPVPPDTVGAVGQDYYIQALNASGGSSWIVYNKSDGSIAAGPFTLGALGSGDCSNGRGDPIILYDNQAGRWMLSEFDNDINTACVYISQTSDPISGGWFAYGFDFSQGIDYPKYGIWDHAYYMTSNDGGGGDNSIGIFQRAPMLAGQPVTNLEITIADMAGFGLQVLMGGDMDGPNPPPNGSPAYLMRQRDDEVHNPGSNNVNEDYIEYFEITPDFATPANTAVVGPILVPTSEFDSNLCGLGLTTCFQQPGGGNALHSFKEMIMNRLQYRNFGTHEAMIGAFVTDVDNTDHGGVRWFELRKIGANPWTLHQEGTISLDADHRWVSGISMDGSGNIALAYNVTGTSLGTFPGIRYIGRLAEDPLGTMPQGEYSVIEGTDANTSGRWGDYAAMTMDPADDLTFWFTGEYSPIGSSFQTRVFSVQFEPCAFTPAGNLAAVANGDNQIDVNWDAVPGAQSYNVYRSFGDCTTGNYLLIAEAVAGTSYEDTTVSGGSTYSYVVRAFDPVEGCLSPFSNCGEAAATGLCLLAPTFTGVSSVTNSMEEACALDLSWPSASTSCGTPVVYNVYRSTMAGFTPGVGNLVASCLTGTTWRDETVENGITYYYQVRAEDQTGNGSGLCGSGNEDSNTSELSGSPTGPNFVSFEDDMESGTGNWTTSAGPLDSGTNPWALTTTGTKGNGNSWFVEDQPVTKDQIITLNNPVAVTSGAILQFSNKHDTEATWDGGVLEYSTDGGSNWQDILEGNGGTVPGNADRFIVGGYVGPLSGGPLGGRNAWNGDSSGFFTTQADLSDMAGESVMFRLRMSCDGSVGDMGWWVDNITVLSGSECNSNLCADLLEALPLWPTRDITFFITNCPLNDPK